MDDTLFLKLIEELEQLDPAEAAEPADKLAEALARLLDPDRETSG